MAAGGLWAQSYYPAPRHVADIFLGVGDRRIRIRDSVEIEGRDRYRFYLAPWLEIEALSLDGSPVEAQIDGQEYRVQLGDSGDHRLVFELAGKLPLRESEGYELSASSADDGDYLPSHDAWLPHVPGESMRFLLRASVPDSRRIVSTGKLIEESVDSGLYRATFEQRQAAEAPSLFAGPYRISERIDGELRLRTYFHPELEEFAGVYLDSALAYLRRFETEIGDYPYSDFHIVSAPLPVGLGYPNLTYVGRRVIPLPFMRGRSLAHEVLHNWWGNAVAIDYSNGNWAEGLSTYMADYGLERDRGADAARAMRERWLRDYAALPDERDRPLTEFRSKQHDAAQVIGYNKAAFVFHMLEQEIGSQAFDEGIRIFWRRHRFSNAGWSGLQAAFEQSAGRGLGWFFSQWITRAGAPRLSIGAHSVMRTDTGYLTRIEILQPVQDYRFPLPVLLETENGSERQAIHVEETRTSLEWMTPARPLFVQLDPGSDLFRRLQAAETPPILRDITLDSNAVTAIDAGNSEFADIARELAARLMDAGTRLLDTDSAFAAGGPLLLLAESSRLQDLLNRLGLALPAELPRESHAAAAWTASLANGRPVLVVSADDADQLRALLRPLPHYGAQSYVLFDSGRAVARGVWPLRRGQLYRDLSATP